jgi:hypothetical protein
VCAIWSFYALDRLTLSTVLRSLAAFVGRDFKLCGRLYRDLDEPERLIILFKSFRKGEQWAWWVMGPLPLLWLSQFLVNPATVHNLVIAVTTALGLTLPYRTFFSASAERSTRVSYAT